MKGGVAAFLAALKNIDLEKLKYSLAVLLTSDEEGPAKNGTKMVIKELVNRGQSFDYCIVGEPSSIENTADNIRVGRRGSVNIDLKILFLPPKLTKSNLLKLLKSMPSSLATA